MQFSEVWGAETLKLVCYALTIRTLEGGVLWFFLRWWTFLFGIFEGEVEGLLFVWFWDFFEGGMLGVLLVWVFCLIVVYLFKFLENV